MIGMTGYEHASLRKGKDAASVERESSSHEIEARMSIDWSLTDDLYDTNDIQKVPATEDVIDAQDNAQEAPIMNDSVAHEQESRNKGSA